MKLKYLYIALEDEDYRYENLHLTSDFNFQTFFLFNYFSREIAKVKFETKNFQFITIRGRKKPSQELVLKEHFKSLEIEIPFDENKYKELYPFINEYPLNGLLKPILKEEEFNNFLFEMVVEALVKGKKMNALIPYEFLLNTTLDFKASGFKNEWLYKSKTFKEFSIKTSLFCKLTCYYFSLELVIEKDKKEIFRKEILKTLPSSIIYKGEFKEILIENGSLKIIRDDYEKTTLYELPLSTIQLISTI
jgi:hypothetical protein